MNTNISYPVIKEHTIWMVKGKACQSAAREIVERCMIALGQNTDDFRLRDEAIHAISPTLQGMLNYVSELKP